MHNQFLAILGPMLMLKDGSLTFSKVFGGICLLILTQLCFVYTSYVQRNSLHELFSCMLGRKTCKYHSAAKIMYKWDIYWDQEMSTSFRSIQKVLYDKLIKEEDPPAFKVHDVSLGFLRNLTIVEFIDPNIGYKIAPGIVFGQFLSKTDRDSITTYEYKITLTSSENNYNSIVNFLKYCDDYYQKECIDRQKILVLSGFVNETRNPEFTVCDLETTKSFDNMFFEMKDKIIERLDSFQQHEEEYKRLGIPYTLGFMFHGSPGTGKTSVIKAIARHTGRHIVILPVDKIKSINDLKSIFLSNKIDSYTIPNQKRLYVFEEVDCGDWKDIVRSRTATIGEEKGGGNGKTELADTLANVMQCLVPPEHGKDAADSMIKKSDEKPLVLGDLLELLDGVIEMHSRMLIMTSNHPERIDAALMRPGRIDMSIQFKKLRNVDVADMYFLWFGEELPQNVWEALEDYTFTQAEIGNLFASRDMEMICCQLRTKTTMPCCNVTP